MSDALSLQQGDPETPGEEKLVGSPSGVSIRPPLSRFSVICI